MTAERNNFCWIKKHYYFSKQDVWDEKLRWLQCVCWFFFSTDHSYWNEKPLCALCKKSSTEDKSWRLPVACQTIMAYVLIHNCPWHWLQRSTLQCQAIGPGALTRQIKSTAPQDQHYTHINLLPFMMGISGVVIRKCHKLWLCFYCRSRDA